MEQKAAKALKEATGNFQYPLRAYRVWNLTIRNDIDIMSLFQYPLRAYRVWNTRVYAHNGANFDLSVPSAGL